MKRGFEIGDLIVDRFLGSRSPENADVAMIVYIDKESYSLLFLDGLYLCDLQELIEEEFRLLEIT